MNAVHSSVPVQVPAGGGGGPERLREVAEDFESLFLNMMMKAMRSSVPRSELFGDQDEIQTYEELRDEELSKRMAHGRGLGIADLIVKQFEGREGEGLDLLGRAANDLSARARAQQAYSEAAAAGVLPAARPGGEQ